MKMHVSVLMLRSSLLKNSLFETDEIDTTSLELIQKSVNMQQENIKQLEEYINKKEVMQ